MSQQEFVPQSQQSQGSRPEGQQPLSDDEIYYPQHPYNWSTGESKAGPPRDEPPSSYNEVIIQRGYRAQDRAANTRRQEQARKSSADSRSGWRQQLSPDGDAYEESYRAYRQYNSWRAVPPWARPQPQGKSAVRLAVLIVLGLLLIKPLLIVAGVLLAVIGGIIGIALLAIVLPIIFVVGIVSIILIAFRVASWQRRIRYR